MSDHDWQRLWNVTAEDAARLIEEVRTQKTLILRNVTICLWRRPASSTGGAWNDYRADRFEIASKGEDFVLRSHGTLVNESWVNGSMGASESKTTHPIKLSWRCGIRSTPHPAFWALDAGSKGDQASHALKGAAAIMAALAAQCVRRASERKEKIEDLRRKYPGMF